VAGGAAARHARHHALRRDPADAVVAAVGHEEHAVRVEHQPARVRERRLDALAVGVAARARPGEHAQAVAVEDADAVVAGVGDVHAPRRRDGEPARVEQRDATTLGCVFVNGLGRRRRRAVEDGDVVRAVHPEGAAEGGRPCERGCWCVWAKWERVASEYLLTVRRKVAEGGSRIEGARVWPFDSRGTPERPTPPTPPPARVGAYASLAFRRGGRRSTPPPLAVVLLPVVGSPHRSGSQARGSAQTRGSAPPTHLHGRTLERLLRCQNSRTAQGRRGDE